MPIGLPIGIYNHIRNSNLSTFVTSNRTRRATTHTYMWRRSAHALSFGRGALYSKNDGNKSFFGVTHLSVRGVRTSAAENQPSSVPNSKENEISEENRAILKRMVVNNSLSSLLRQDALLNQLRIPRAALEKLLKDKPNLGLVNINELYNLVNTSPLSNSLNSNSNRPPQQQQLKQTPPLPPSSFASSQQQQQQQQQQRPSSASPPRPIIKASTGSFASRNSSQPPLSTSSSSSQPFTPNTMPLTSNSSTPPPPNPKASIRDCLNQQRIFLQSYAPGNYRIKCPKCQGGSDGEQSFSVTVEPDSRSALWQCFRGTCGYTGSSHVDRITLTNEAGFFVSPTNRKRKEEPPVRPKLTLEPLTEEMAEFFTSRGISKSTLERNGVASQVVYDPAKKKEDRVIAFPYTRDNTPINVKYRTLDKRFWQIRGAEKILYGLDDVAGESEIIIVEGEMDKLALEEAGFRNVVSVPDGAPARVRDGDLPPVSEDTKYSYLWNCRAWLDQAVRIVIATDNDAPGDALAEELARRLGRERCWRVRWPLTRKDHEYATGMAMVGDSDFDVLEKNSENDVDNDVDGINNDENTNASSSSNTDDSSSSTSSSSSLDARWYRKDANEVLMRDSPAVLRSFVETAEPLPIRGLLRFHEYYDDIVKHYFLELRDGQGVSTGWPALDRYYKVVPGELTIVTGVPNSGKSEWIDALLSNLTEMHGWTFALCSMEKRATDHARQLAEKYVGRPFFDLPYGRGIKRMTAEELEIALDWADDRFHLIRYEDEQLPSVDWVLEIAKAAVYRYGIRGLVIDPYNELDHQRPASMSETEYVSQMLTKVKRFAQTAGVHVWFVAHPRQLRDWKGAAPNLYDISGSAHFINKADNGIVVHRNRDPEAPTAAQVQVLVRKVRNKAAGTIGDCVLEYERVNGRYLDFDDSSPPRTSERIQVPYGNNNNNGQHGGMNSNGFSSSSSFSNGNGYIAPDGTVHSGRPGDDGWN